MPQFRHPLARLMEFKLPSLEVCVSWFIPIGSAIAVFMGMAVLLSYGQPAVSRTATVTAESQVVLAAAELVSEVAEEKATFAPVVMTFASVSADAFLPEPEMIEHPVGQGETLIGILRRYCRDDYEVVARENGVNPNVIYANKTVLKFKNGCSSNAPSVFVQKRVSPRELVRDGEASSGKHISRIEAARASTAASAVALAASAPALSASQPIPAAAPAPLAAASVPQAELPVAVAVLRPAKPAPAPFPSASQPNAAPAADDDRPLSDIYHREIYRIVALRNLSGRSKAQSAELARLTSVIRQAVLARYKLRNPDCLYASEKEAGETGTERTQYRLRCIRENYGPEIDAIAAARNLSPAYITAVVFVESRGQPDAISPTGCTGLKQFTIASSKLYRLRDRFDPFESLRAGADHLVDNLRLWRGNYAKATAHFNIGSIVVGQAGFDASAFPYTQAVLGMQRMIEKGTQLPAGSPNGRGVVKSQGAGHHDPVPALTQAAQSSGVQREYLRLAPGQPPMAVTTLR
ncbi:MAG: transglycosylase SLT domain-containing protein [Undibacterium sp.]